MGSAAASWTSSYFVLVWTADLTLCVLHVTAEARQAYRPDLLVPRSTGLYAAASNPASSRLGATLSSPRAHLMAASSHWCASLLNAAAAGEHTRKDADKTDSLAFLKFRHELKGGS